MSKVKVGDERWSVETNDEGHMGTYCSYRVLKVYKNGRLRIWFKTPSGEQEQTISVDEFMAYPYGSEESASAVGSMVRRSFIGLYREMIAKHQTKVAEILRSAA